MTGRPIPCTVYERDGTPLTDGRCVSADPAAGEVVVAALEQPGRVVARCILGGVQEVELHVAGAPRRSASIARLYMDPQLGRSCVLRLSS